MANTNNATCSICGKEYYKCISCRDSIKNRPWQTVCCSADCYKVFQVVKGFSTGIYTKEEFKSKLKNIDLSNLENYRDHIKALIKDALKEDKRVVEPIADNVETAVEETVEKPIYSRKRNYSVENVETE